VSLLIVCALLLAIACKGDDGTEVWYGVSDRYGFMIALGSEPSAMVVAAIPLPIVSDYRASLAQKGIASDDLGAVGSLFGLPADHYLKGDAALWREARALCAGLDASIGAETADVDDLARVLLDHAEPLSKSPLVDTLEQLSGPKTTGDDVRRVMALLARQKPRLRVYNLGLFLPGGLESDILGRWTNEWTAHVLREAM